MKIAYCTCPQDGTDRNCKAKPTKVDKEDFCIYCGYAAVYKIESDNKKSNKKGATRVRLR